MIEAVLTTEEQQEMNEAILAGDTVWRTAKGVVMVTPKQAVEDFGFGVAHKLYSYTLQYHFR